MHSFMHYVSSPKVQSHAILSQQQAGSYQRCFIPSRIHSFVHQVSSPNGQLHAILSQQQAGSYQRYHSGRPHTHS